MPEVKATAILYIQQKIRQLGGDREETLLALLSPAARETYHGALPLSWVPADQAAAIYENAAPLLYPGEPSPVQRLGHDACRSAYSSIYKALLRVTTIPFVIEQAVRLWRNHHSEGTPNAHVVEKGKVELTVADYPALPEGVREVVSGYLAALCEMTGAKRVRVWREDHPPIWRWFVTWR